MKEICEEIRNKMFNKIQEFLQQFQWESPVDNQVRERYSKHGRIKKLKQLFRMD